MLILSQLADKMYLLRHNIYKWTLIGLTVFYITVIASLPAEAFTVSPGRVEVILPAGESYTGSFTIGNSSDATVKVKVTVEDWSFGQDGREVIRGDIPSLSWLEFVPQELELEPHQSSIINYTVTLTKEAKGEYAAMIYFGTVPDPSKGGISVISRIGNALYVIVEGTEIVKGKITDINISRIEPLKVDVAIRNEGNIHIRPKGKITMRKKDLFLRKKDRESIEIPFNKAGFPVLPKQRYIFETHSKEKLSPGRYGLELDIEFGKEVLNRKLEFNIDRKGRVTYP